MSRFAQIVVFAAVMYPLAVSAQGNASTRSDRPDFSGTWAMDTTRSDSAQPDDTSPVLPTTLVINQNNKEVRIETTRAGKRQLASYPIERPESPQAVGTSGRGVGSILKWEGGNLVTLTPHEVNGMAVTTVETRSLSPDGNEMTIVTVIEVQHGYQNGANYSAPAKDVFRRVR